MGLEAATFIDGLNSSWPLGTDSATLGDNHLRLIKSVLKSVFPGAGGNGFAKQITATEDELNFLSGVTGSLASAVFPSGTILPFYQASPPPGWSLVSLSTSYMLVAGGVTGGTVGGADSPILNNKVPSHTHLASGSTSSDGAHSHSTAPHHFLLNDLGGTYGLTALGNITEESLVIASDGAHSHTLDSITIATNSGAANWAPTYAGMILCSKN